jgi:hypothetical protein
MASRTPAALCAGRLSIMTISLRLSVGAPNLIPYRNRSTTSQIHFCCPTNSVDSVVIANISENIEPFRQSE